MENENNVAPKATRKGLIFCGGFLAGVVVTFAILAIVGLAHQGSGAPLGSKMFDKPGKVIEDRDFKVLQAVNDHAALAYAKSGTYYLGTLYLIVNDGDEYYYDNQIITVPYSKVVRQVGIYKYTSKSEVGKTVPIIKIMNK